VLNIAYWVLGIIQSLVLALSIGGKRNIAIIMNAATFSQATDIDYFITNASASIVTPE
jgi:hypothetical protein